MSIATFRVGEQPTAPLLVPLLDPQGGPLDLTGYTVVRVVCDAFPPGASRVVDAAGGTVERTFTGPFTLPGRYEVRVELEGSGGVDITASGTVDVLITAPAWVTPADAYATTGRLVGPGDLAVATRQVSAVVGVDLTVLADRERFGHEDRRLLALAVAHQGAALAKAGEDTAGAAGLSIPAGADEVRVGDLWVKLGGAAGPALDPVAARYLHGMSTRVRDMGATGLTEPPRGPRPRDDWNPALWRSR